MENENGLGEGDLELTVFCFEEVVEVVCLEGLV
jgi:hypothetical protein